MNTENLVILKNLHNYDDYEDVDFVVATKSEVADGYLHDTYSNNGVALDEYAASDYCLANTECNMESEISLAIMQSEDFRPFLNQKMVEEDEEYAPIMQALKKFDTRINSGTSKIETIGDYDIYNSLYESDHFITISRH